MFDALLIAPFRLLPNPQAAFYLGVLLLALASTALGKACAALVARAHRTRYQRVEGEVKHHSELSFRALQQNDKKAYLLQNTLAQEAYGDSMALSAGRAAALLWPGMIALAWLCWRFEGVPMPYLWASAGPASVFFPPYIAALWIVSRYGKKPKASTLPTTAQPMNTTAE
jgi:hypothetical protein